MPLHRLFTIGDVVAIRRLQDEIDRLQSKLKKKEKEIAKLKEQLKGA